MEDAGGKEVHVQKVAPSLSGFLVTASICSGMQCMQVTYEVGSNDFGGVTQATAGEVVFFTNNHRSPNI